MNRLIQVFSISIGVLIVTCGCGSAHTPRIHEPIPQSTESPNADAFTVIFIGDPEERMRGNTRETLQRHVSSLLYLRKNNSAWFDHEGGKSHPIRPDIVIIGGDISADRSTSIASDFDLWKPLLNAGIPVLAGFGNHDWEPKEWGDGPGYSMAGHNSNLRTTAFTRETYRASAETCNQFSYREVPPTSDHGPVTFHATHRGVEIVNFNTFLYQPSYTYPFGWPLSCNPLNGGAGCQTFISAEDQIAQMESLLSADTATPVLFVQHYPLSTGDHWWDDYGASGTHTEERRQRLLEMIAKREHSVLLAGHNHRARHHSWIVGDREIDEHIAPYFGGTGGYIALLVSPTEGILEVRTIAQPGSRGRILK